MRDAPRFRGLPSRVAARAMASRFARPVARVALVAAALLFLAILGRAGLPGSLGGPALAAAPTVASAPPLVPVATPPVALPEAPSPEPVGSPPSPAATTTGAVPAVAARTPASADDPVILNTATVDDLRRLPGIGEKRANAILALRARLGRFRAIEDLLKVKGIGRAMLKRLRPLVRIDPALSPADAGVPRGAGGPRAPTALG